MAKKKPKRGLGSIQQLPSGRWHLRYTDPNGVRRNARTTFSKQAQAEFELTRIRESIENGTWHVDQSIPIDDLDPKKLTLRELASHWRKQRVSSSGDPLSPNTLGEYERLIQSVLPFSDKPIRLITTRDIEKWRESELHRAPNQTVKAYKHLKTLMTYAHKRRWIAANPCTIERGTSYTPSEPPIPTDKQVETILEKISEVGRALITLGSEAGLRRGEIMELRRKDISTIDDAGEKRVVVSVRRAVIWLKGGAPLVKKPKSSKSVRDIVLGLRASRIILSYLGTVNLNPESLLFSSPAGFDQHWSESTYRKYIAEGRELAGYFRLHSLRTYHLTRFRQSGATEKETMDRGGHADIKTAMRYQRSTGRDAELLRAVGD